MSTGQEWQLRQTTRKLPRYRDLEEFLSNRCAAFETSEEFSDSTSGCSNLKVSKYNSVKRSLVISEKEESMCICCKGHHRVWKCDTFKAMPTSERIAIVKSSRACFNCFSTYHGVKTCKSKSVCRLCQMKHNSMLLNGSS